MAKGKHLSRKQKGWVLILASLVVVFYLMNHDMSTAREAQFDGTVNDFTIELVDYDSTLEVGDMQIATLKITNPGSSSGEMYVQCSILDEAEQSWLSSLQASASYLSTDDNCVADEPFTQTTHVYLSGEESITLGYTVQVPNLVGKTTARLYCAAFEQCASEGEPYTSDAIKRTVTIVASDGDSSNNNYADIGDACSEDSDCDGYYLGDTVCLNGYCADIEDVPSEPWDLDVLNIEWPSLTDSTLSAWIEDHEILLWGIGICALLIGTMLAYSSPKRPQPPAFGR